MHFNTILLAINKDLTIIEHYFVLWDENHSSSFLFSYGKNFKYKFHDKDPEVFNGSLESQIVINYIFSHFEQVHFVKAFN